MNTIIKIKIALLIIISLHFSQLAMANSGGITGRSISGCSASGCHGGSPNQGPYRYSGILYSTTSSTWSSSSSRTIQNTDDLDLLLFMSRDASGGDTTPLFGLNMSATGGTLSESSSTLQTLSSQITHSSANSPGCVSGGPSGCSATLEKQFNNMSWSVPSTNSGDYTIYVCGNIVDGDGIGTNDTGDNDSGGGLCDSLSVAVRPRISSWSGTLTHTEGDGLEVIDSFVQVFANNYTTSGDDANLATISISSALTGDQLSCSGQPVGDGISCSGSGTATLTLSGSATYVEYENAIEAVRFQNTSQDPTSGTRTVNITIRDVDNNTSTSVSKSISVVAVNDAPTTSGWSGSTTYTEGNGTNYITIDNSISVADVDNNLNRAEITITNAQSGDQLNCNGTFGGISCSGNNTSSIVLTGTTTPANYDSTISAIRFRNTSNNPNTTTRNVSMRVRDVSSSFSTLANKSINVTAVNDAPVITATNAPANGTENVLISFTPSFTDPDDSNNGSALIWSLLNAPTGMTISSTGLIQWTPANGQTTSGTVTVRLADGGENSAAPDTDTFSININSVNTPPTITATNAPANGTEDTLISFTPSFNDADDSNNGVDLSWSLINAPTGMTISSTGLIQWTPAEGQTASGTVTVRLADGGENGSTPDTDTFSISITAVNDSPVVNSTNAPASATEDIAITPFTPTFTDPDDSNNGSDLSWSLLNAPAGMTISSVGAINWTPTNGQTTSGTVTVRLADGGEDSSTPGTNTFSINVNAVNDPPSITATNAPANGTEDILISFTPSFTDIDDSNNGSDLSWSLLNAPAGMTISSTGLIQWTPANGQTSSGTVTVRLADGGENGSTPDTDTFSINVTAVNDAPNITATNAPANGTQQVQISFTPSFTDPDDSNNGTDLSWNLLNAPAGMTISSTGLIQWTPGLGDTTSGSVTIQLADGGENGAPTASAGFTIIIGINDADNDLIPANNDNCPDVSNADQADIDGDGIGDVCDPDVNNDGLIDSAIEFNIEQNSINSPYVFLDATNTLVTITATAVNSDIDFSSMTFNWSPATEILALPSYSDTGNSINFEPANLLDGSTDSQSFTINLSISNGITSVNDSIIITVNRIGPDDITGTFFFDCNNDGIDEGNNDCDGDGVNNSTEGFVDNDGDGIPDFQDDSNLTGNEIYDQSGDISNAYEIATNTGLSLRLGETARMAQRTGIAISLQDLESTTGSAGAVDPGYSHIGGIFSFEIANLLPGNNAQIVIPLSSTLPANAVYRKYINGAWTDFVIDENNTLASAPYTNSVTRDCPAIGDSSYVSGLIAFNGCIQLTIQDGGPNDTDGEANGVIRDPSGPAVTSNGSSRDTFESVNGGGRLSVIELMLLLLLILRINWYRIRN